MRIPSHEPTAHPAPRRLARRARAGAPRWSRALVPFALAGLLCVGCGESTPGGSELVGPQDRSAVPSDPEIKQMTEAERKEERLEAAGVKQPEPGDDGFETGEPQP